MDNFIWINNNIHKVKGDCISFDAEKGNKKNLRYKCSGCGNYHKKEPTSVDSVGKYPTDIRMKELIPRLISGEAKIIAGRNLDMLNSSDKEVRKLGRQHIKNLMSPDNDTGETIDSISNLLIK